MHVLARRDDSIRTELEDLIRNEGADWVVELTDGIVHILGPADHHECRIAEVLARSVAGVVAVRLSHNAEDPRIAST